MSPGQFMPITRKANLVLLRCRREQKSVRFVDEFHKIYVIEPGEEIDEDSDDITSRSYMAWRIDMHLGPMFQNNKSRSVE